jgi:hypothetical protein
MKAVFGVVSLLVVLAVVALLASRSLKTTVAVPSGTASAPEATVRQQAVQIPEQVRQDVNKALEESTRRLDAADK